MPTQVARKASKPKKKPFDPSGIKLDDPRLWNIGELAIILGVHRSLVTRMVKRGFKMPFGKASVAMAHDFIKANAKSLRVEDQSQSPGGKGDSND